MPILFSAVAREHTILSKYASCEGNFMEIAEKMLIKIPSKNNKMTYSHGHYLLHYIIENTFFYFCITDKTCQRSRSFLFLNEIKRRFKQADKNSFSRILADEMYRYSEDYSTITIRKGELDELNTIGVGCSESILGEKVLFVNNTENLTFSTISCVSETPQQVLVSKNNSKIYFIMVTVILVFVWGAISIFGSIPLVIITCVFLLATERVFKVEKRSMD